jgi:hypothetical protein
LKKNFLEIGCTGIKRSGILRRFQKCAEVLSLAKGKNIFTEKLIFRGLENFAKKRFMRKNLWELWELGS